MKLYDSIGPNPKLVRMFAAEKGFAFSATETVDLRGAANRKQPYLAKNPAGQLPCVELDDGMIELDVAMEGRARDQLWAARKALSPALRSVAPGKINEDVVVPVSRIPELVAGVQALALRVIAERLENREAPAEFLNVTFQAA